MVNPMKIKYLKLKNFRQFIGEQTLHFSTLPDKNITLVLGNGGAGKTTLAQSFSWVFYGETDFKKSEVFNKEALNKMKVFSEMTVSVDLCVEHRGQDYIISRSQTVKKENKNPVFSPSKLMVETKVGGVSNKLHGKDAIAQVDEIMPKDLFPYFFFDGERIIKIGTEIDLGKGEEFAGAIKSMLGLITLYNAKDHLQKVGTKYRSEIQSNAHDKKYAELTQEFDNLTSKIKDLEESKIPSKTTEVEFFENKREKLHDQIVSLGSVSDKQERSRRLEQTIKVTGEDINNQKRALFSLFSTRSFEFFAFPLAKKAQEIIKAANLDDSGIPGMDESSIHYLISREECICGTRITKDSEAHKNLNRLIKFLPPNNIGAEVGSVKDISYQFEKNSQRFLVDLHEARKKLDDSVKEYNEYVDELNILNDQIAKTPDVKMLKEQEQKCKDRLNVLRRELQNLEHELREANSKLDSNKKERSNYKITDKKNKRLAYLESLVKKVQDRIEAYVAIREKDKREQLQKEINEIFSAIFDNNMRIEIDEKFRVTVINTEVNESLEKSQSQNVSITLSFIAGVIKLARDKLNTKGTDTSEEIDENLVNEPYPLVMDAPLSSFDKTRIKNVCDLLPGISEQVIIFIKDTDGDLAEEHLKDYIGIKYQLDAFSTVATSIRRL